MDDGPASDYGRGMMRQITLLAVVLSLAGCAALERWQDRVSSPNAAAIRAPAPATVNQRLPGTAGGQSAEALDTTTEAERAAALAAQPATGAALGKVKVSLGNPTDPGFWLQSPLVTAPRQGRVEAGGTSVKVELRPGQGGAQMSLPAFRALGLPLTSLPEVTVYAQ